MKTRKIPMRMCLGCREMHPKKELIRIVHALNGEVLIDPTGKMAGRGAYLCNKTECMRKALKQKQIERAFGCPVSDSTKQFLIDSMEESTGGI